MLLVYVFIQFVTKKMLVIEFPVLFAAAFAGWAFPQFINLYITKEIPLEILDKGLLMNLLCFAAVYVGYRWPRRPFLFLNIDFSFPRVEKGVFLLFLFALVFYVLLNRLPVQMLERSQWEGLPVAYLFFCSNLATCTIIAIFLIQEKRPKFSWPLIFILCGGSFYYFDLIFLRGRRASALEAVLLFLCLLWFQKRNQPSRLIILFVGVALTLFFTAIGQYRSAVVRYSGERQWAALLDIDFISTFKEVFISGGGNEMKNCAVLIDSIDQRSTFDYGLFHYNSVIQNLVPRQLVGQDLKESLFLKLRSTGDLAFYDAGYTPGYGTTLGGATDAFGSFWYFGCLKFFLIGWFMRKLYLGAMQDWFTSKFSYVLLLTPALHSITHSTHRFFAEIISMTIFLGPLLWYAKKRKLEVVISKEFNYSSRSKAIK
jgi:hypothetical protein